MVAGRHGGAESRRSAASTAAATIPGRGRRPTDGDARRRSAGGPAFISENAEEQHYLDVIREPRTSPQARAAARLALAHLYERAGLLAEAVELYERNVWDGARTPATYAGLAAAYRRLGRHDLADAALEQVRRQGRAAQADAPAGDAVVGPATPPSRRRGGDDARSPSRAARRAPAAGPSEAGPGAPTSARPDRAEAAPPTGRSAGLSRAERAASLRERLAGPQRRGAERPVAPRVARRPAAPAGAGALALLARLAETARAAGAGASQAAGRAGSQARRSAVAFFSGQAGRRTLIASTVLLPIVVGLGVFVAIVVTSTRTRTTDAVAAAPTPAPVATVVPTVAPTSAIPAVLAESAGSARLLVKDVGSEGLSLRRSPGVGQRIKVWPDGTALVDLKETAEQGGKSWRRVRDPEGNDGWVAADFLMPESPPAGATSAVTAGPGAGGGSRSAPAAPPFASGGLGLGRAEWEKAHGQPTRTSIFMEYLGGRLVVGFLDEKVWHLERVWKPADAVALDAARDDARAFLPSDAALMQSVDRGDGRIIDVYSSTILAGRYGPTSWNGGRSGTFSIQYRYRSADRLITSAMFRLGDALF